MALEYERRRQNARFKKLENEQRLKSRLLSPEEIQLIAERSVNEPMTNQERMEIIRKFKAHKSEEVC